MSDNIEVVEVPELEQTGKEKKKKKLIQFSKGICIFSCVFVVLCWVGNLVLLLLGKEQMSDVISVGFTVFGGFVTGGYFGLSGVRDCSKNKHAKDLHDVGWEV